MISVSLSGTIGYSNNQQSNMTKMKFILTFVLFVQLITISLSQNSDKDEVVLNHHHDFEEMVDVLEQTREKCSGKF